LELEGRDREKQARQEQFSTEMLHFRHSGGIFDHEIPQVQRQIDRLMDDKNQLLLKLRHEELLNNEIILRNEELEEILARRDKEYSLLEKEHNTQQEDNQTLMEEEERLLDARDKLRQAADKVTYANNEIEKEIHEILRVDEAVMKAIDIRDRKASPVIHQARQQSLIIQEKMSNTPIQIVAKSANYEKNVPIKSLALPLNHL
jgi:hypothetical protein